MMQNSRQRKKVSQQKKRYHDRIKGKDGGVEAAVPAIAKGKLQEVSKTLTPQPVETGKRKSKENYLGTNLDRYEDLRANEVADEPYKETEELSQQRLMQLLNLPIHHTPSPLTTQPLSTITSSTSLQSTTFPPFLTLDCSALAESLSSLPLHTKLDISLDLLELSKLPVVDEVEMGGREALLSQEPLATGIDLTMCSKKRSRHVFEFQKVSPSLMLLGEHENGCQIGGQGERDVQGSEKIKTLPVKSDSVSVAETNEELDKLLERSLLLKERGTVGKIGGDTAAGVDKGVDTAGDRGVVTAGDRGVVTAGNRSVATAGDRGVVTAGDRGVTLTKEVVSAASERSSTSTAAANTEDTDELDDMLDELLR